MTQKIKPRLLLSAGERMSLAFRRATGRPCLEDQWEIRRAMRAMFGGGAF